MFEISMVVWAVVGLALLIAEIFSGAFVLLFFGAAALVVSLAKWLGLANAAIEIVAFGALGFIGTLTLRKKIMASLPSRGGYRPDNTLILDEDIPAGGVATVSYQGSKWTAHNDSTHPLKKGDTALIVRTEGVRLFLKPKGS